MKCFIAMAFGRPDTDKVYDEMIHPALIGRGVQPVRIDRIEHNEDIDDKMMAELQNADFVIADLTYARPSVYFEAGFAEARNISVIYTVRRDHLAAQAEDVHGNLRVHFDLLMRNVIDWSNPSDHVFGRRLGSRIDSVSAPLRVDKQKFAITESNRKLFSSSSIFRRRQDLLEASEEVLREKANNFPVEETDSSDEGNLTKNLRTFGGRARGTTIEYLTVNFLGSGTSESDAERVADVFNSSDVYDLNTDQLLTRAMLFRDLYIVVCLSPLYFPSVSSVLSDFDKLPEVEGLVEEGQITMPVLPYEEWGFVYYPMRGTKSSWFGRSVSLGAGVSNPPSGILASSVEGRPDYSRLKVIECDTRKIPRMKIVSFVHSVESIQEFKQSLRKAIKNVTSISLATARAAIAMGEKVRAANYRAVAEKAPAKKAVVKKAPAKRAAVKNIAKKAAAKKAPAKKAIRK